MKNNVNFKGAPSNFLIEHEMKVWLVLIEPIGTPLRWLSDKYVAYNAECLGGNQAHTVVGAGIRGRANWTVHIVDSIG